MIDQRWLGCIPAAIQSVQAAAAGIKSDEQKIAESATPWDLSDSPSIINYNSDWETYLTKLADSYDELRDSGIIPPVWEMANKLGLNIEELCGSIQRTNDCTAWATTRAAICLAITQRWLGSEIDIEAYNPDGIYAYSSGVKPVADTRVPDNGRTIYAIAQTACEIGNFTKKSIGEYRGNARYTADMIHNQSLAGENQMGFAYVGELTPEKKADLIILSLRARKPVIIGNMIALKDGTEKNADGVYCAKVGSSWGGGHATTAVDVKKVGNNYYPFIYNSHGKRYHAPDGSPDEGAYITKEDLIKYLSGSFADIMPATYIERPRTEFTNLNIGGVNG